MENDTEKLLDEALQKAIGVVQLSQAAMLQEFQRLTLLVDDRDKVGELVDHMFEIVLITSGSVGLKHEQGEQHAKEQLFKIFLERWDSVKSEVAKERRQMERDGMSTEDGAKKVISMTDRIMEQIYGSKHGNADKCPPIKWNI
jgi:hypothetical protein